MSDDKVGLEIVANRPRFACHSQARTLIHSYNSAIQGPFGSAGPAE